MKKGDLILMIALMVGSLLFFIPAFSSAETGSTVVVEISGEEVYRASLNENQTFEVEGTLGPVTVSIEDGKVAVTQENSPHHYCSYQGYVSNPKTPIICLPNETIVKIISDEEAQEDVIIQ